MKVEAALDSELEAEQDATLESLDQEEQSYLQEIAREESREVEVEEPEMESDLGVSMSLWISLQAPILKA